MKEKVKCLKCGSTKLLYWREKITTEFFKIKSNGDYEFDHDGSDDCNGPSGYECQDCGCMWSEYGNKIIRDGFSDYE